jgi:hypothetical protein
MTNNVLSVGRPEPTATNGIRVGAGDLNLDGRDEVLVTTGWGGDGTASRGVVVGRGGGDYDVRGAKRYAKRGIYKITVTLADNQYRVSVAQSTARVQAAN